MQSFDHLTSPLQDHLKFGSVLILIGLCHGLVCSQADETCMSPYMAKITDQEEFVYVWTLGVDGLGDGSDKLVTVDTRHKSPTFGKVIHSYSVGGQHEAHHGGFGYGWVSLNLTVAGQTPVYSKTELKKAGIAKRPELALPASPDFDFTPPEPGSYRLPAIKKAADGEVLYTTGHACSLRELMQGRITILSFIYLRCASGSACPMATGTLHQLHQASQKDPELQEKLRLISMSFDPAHDTPQKMANYGKVFRRDAPDSDWLFLTTRSEQELKPILKAYNQTVDSRGNSKDPLGPYYHPVRVYLIDRQGQIRNIYSFSTLDPRLILTDVRTLLLEEKSTNLSQSKK